ncbi:MAG: threonine synthase [Myxococcales bacterium]|nr:threonine synthase [Myxococcales bacterium]
MTAGILARWADRLPSLGPATPRLSLGEGATPLVAAPRLAAAIAPGVDLHLKFEGQNPTGSFKDRGMVLAVAKAVEAGAHAIVCASTGNTSASAAAYAARAGLQAFVLLPKGAVALGKLAQALQHGARVLAVDGNFDVALRIVQDLAARHPIALVNSVNPHRVEGQTTAAFEIVEAWGEAPDALAIPVGNAGNISAYWLGFQRAVTAGAATRTPRMLGFQAAGSAPIVRGHPIDDPHTVATAIKIGRPASWRTAVAARDESGGAIEAVSDEQILRAWSQLARLEGVFCEPASAAGVAGVAQMHARTPFAPGTRIVCVLTGHGLKDPDRAIACAPTLAEVAADITAVERALLG